MLLLLAKSTWLWVNPWLVLEIVSLSDQLWARRYLTEQADKVRLIKENIVSREGQLADVERKPGKKYPTAANHS